MKNTYSSSYKSMSKRSGKYTRGKIQLKKLNVSAPPIKKLTTNNMKRTSKAFSGKATSRMMNTSPVSNAKKGRAVSKATSGRPGAARSFKAGMKGDNSRVMQVTPQQSSGSSKKLSAKVTKNPVKQNKGNISNMGSKSRMMKSLRKTMGY